MLHKATFLYNWVSSDLITANNEHFERLAGVWSVDLALNVEVFYFVLFGRISSAWTPDSWICKYTIKPYCLDFFFILIT